MPVEEMLTIFLGEKTIDVFSNLLVAISGVVVTQFLFSKKQNIQRPRIVLRRGSFQGLGRMSVIVKNDGYSDAEDIKIYFPDHEPYEIDYLKKSAQTKDIAFSGFDLGRLLEKKEKIMITYKTQWGQKSEWCWPIVPMSTSGDEANYATFGVKEAC
jgi:hypothetical protein